MQTLRALLTAFEFIRLVGKSVLGAGHILDYRMLHCVVDVVTLYLINRICYTVTTLCPKSNYHSRYNSLQHP